jgi:hypothetical protein
MLTMFAAVGSGASLIQAAPLCHTARTAYCKLASKRQSCGALTLISSFRRGSKGGCCFHGFLVLLLGRAHQCKCRMKRLCG